MTTRGIITVFLASVLSRDLASMDGRHRVSRFTIGWCDVVHAHGFMFQNTALAVVLARLRGKPCVLTDHGGIQRTSQQIPIVFAGSDLSGKDLRAEVRSVDIMPTILEAMGITPIHRMDGTAYELPRAKR